MNPIIHVVRLCKRGLAWASVAFLSFVFFYSIVTNAPDSVVRIDPNFTLDKNAPIYQYPREIDSEKWNRQSRLRLKLGLNTAQHKELVDLLDVFAQLMEKNNISFVMFDGTLLGSYFFHDFIPWDDDLDLMADWADREKIFKLFSDPKLRETYGVCSYQSDIDWYSLETLQGKNPKLQTEEDIKKNADVSDFKFKFFLESSQNAGKYPWKWPFVDIKYYNITNNLVKKVDRMWPSRTKTYTHEFFPFHYRPFSRLWLPAPRDTRACLRKKYGRFTCTSHTWDHIHEVSKSQTRVPCQAILDVYPHVHRSLWLTEDGRAGGGKNKNESVLESLVIGKKLLHSVVVQEPWYDVSGYYDLLV